MRCGTSVSLATTAGLLTLATGCGGGAALMHPAHVLAQNELSAGAGVSGHFALGGAEDSIDRAQAVSSTEGLPLDQQARRDFAEGAVVQALTSPGVAPWVGVRAGLGFGVEGGITYTGRVARVDGRYAIEGDHLAVSFGGGVARVLRRPGSTSSIGARADGGIVGLDLREVDGWTFDVPVLLGWRSNGDVVQIWAGPRGGAETLGGEVRVLTILDVDPTGQAGRIGPLDARRFFIGGLLGFAIGVDPIWVAVELDVAYQNYSGTLELDDSTGATLGFDEGASGLTMTPTGALIAKF